MQGANAVKVHPKKYDSPSIGLPIALVQNNKEPGSKQCLILFNLLLYNQNFKL